LYLQKSVCLLPNRAEVRAALQPILLRVRAHGGTVRKLTIQVEGSDHDALVAEQRSERDKEYQEVVERVPAFLSEITMETARGRVHLCRSRGVRSRPRTVREVAGGHHGTRLLPGRGRQYRPGSRSTVP
jgi:hypothetical protein